ncbi:MAG: kelch repeat-containing protein [Acidaminococcaceae bacterium]
MASEFGVAASFNTAAVYIRTPTITSPVDGQLDVSLSATLTGDDFSVYGGNDEHVASRWQYSTVPDFSTVLIDSGWVASPLKSYSPSVTIPRKTRLYGRLKYKGKLLGESEWSQVVSFVTADQLKGIYTQKASGPTIVSFGLMVEIGGDIYLTGGSSKLETWKYSPAQNSWTQLANALAYIYETESAAVIDGKLYVCGATGPSRSKRLYRYNPQNNTWADLGAAPGESAGCYMGAIGGKLYLFGGRGYSNIGSTSMHEYDPGTGLWTQKTALPSTGRYDVAGGVIGGKLYIAGGIRDGSMGGTSRADTWSYEPSLDKWTQLASMPWAKYLAAGAVVDGRLYVDGGNNSDGSYGGSLLMYDPVANGWAEIQNNLRTQNRRDHAAVGVGSKMYIYCAVGTAGTLYQVE